MSNRSLSEFLDQGFTESSIALTDEKRDALIDASKSDASQVIEYLETEKEERLQGDKANRMIALLTLAVALMTLIATIAIPLILR